MRYLKDDELQLATRFLFLSMAIVVLNQDIDYMKQGKFKINEPYIDLINKMLSLAINERRILRKTMLDKKIQVVQLNQNDSFSSFLFICQGKEEKRNYFNPTIRKRVEQIIRSLMEKALQSFQESAVANS